MTTPSLDKGKIARLQVVFRKNDPFVETPVEFDPTSATYEVFSPAGGDPVASGALINHSLGNFYALIQTETSWLLGSYAVTVTSTSPEGNDLENQPLAFRLT